MQFDFFEGDQRIILVKRSPCYQIYIGYFHYKIWNKNQGLPRITEMPKATNMERKGWSKNEQLFIWIYKRKSIELESVCCITLKYGDKLLRVKGDLFEIVSTPQFYIGQKVRIKDKNEDAIITDIMWHYDKKEHYYFVTVSGKKKSKRYFEFELNI